MTFRKFLLNDRLVLIIIIIITLSIANNTEYDTEYTAIDYNSVLIPFHYNVKILLYFKDNLLFGDCSISININRQIQSIKLNSARISIIEAILTNSKNRNVYKFSSSTNYNNILTINFDEKIFPDTYTLNVMYIRTIHEKEGNSVDVHQDKLGDLMLNLINYEVMKARQLFPCKDELPSNSTIKIAIKHDEKYTVLSNMPIRVQNKAANGMMWTDFDESLRMSVKQISFVITTFTNVSSQFANITIWCRQSVQKYVLHAINVLEKVVPYFKQKYLMELWKLDIVVFWHPHSYFTALGFIFLKEADIIYNEDLHPVIRQREVAHTIARQLAFLWCNDTLLWSKEGFVTYLGTHILDQIYQNDHMMDLMVVQAQQDSFRYDTSFTLINSSTLESTNNFENSLNSPLNYLKSFIVWRMLHYLMSDMFWTNIRTYINKDHSNMISDDLWTTIQTLYKLYKGTYSTFKNINRYLKGISNYITNNYYFVLNVIKQNSLNLQKSVVQINIQPLYLLDNNEMWIHVTGMLQWNLNNTLAFWTTNTQNISFLYDMDLNNWIIFNIQLTGYYRVNYNSENWQKLMHFLNSETEDYNKIHILNRAQIIDDAFYFFLQRQLSYNFFWNLTNFVIRDVNFVTWYPMIKVFESFTCIFPPEYGTMVTTAMKNRIDQLLTKIGYFEKPNDNTSTIYLRQEAVKWACILGISKCQEVAALEFNNELQNSMKTNNLMWKKWVYCHGLRTASYAIWYKIWQKWNTTSDERYLEYLTCSETFAYNLLNIILTEQIQPNDNKRTIMRANAFLFTVAKYAKINTVFSYLIKIFEDFRLSSHTYRNHDIIATLIVIITNVHNSNQLRKIAEHASNYINKYQITKAIERKIKKRRVEYERLIHNYAYYFS